MNTMRCFTIAAAIITMSRFASAQHWCPPAQVPRDPGPAVDTAPSSAGTNCLEKVLDSFTLNEETTRTVNLKKNQSYWFAASGCPKMGTIRIAITDAQGKVLRKAESYSPSFCFKAENDGQHKIVIKAVTLSGSSTSGNIDSCFSESKCK
jgi:hypothetical protein